MIAETITGKIGEALKARDEIRLSTLRMLSSALNYEKIAKQHELTNEEEITAVRKEAKRRTDAISAFKDALGKPSSSTPEELRNKIEKEESELTILKEFLPAEISEEDLLALVETAIKETGAARISDMGKVIGNVMAKAKGGVDGGRVSAIVKEKLA